jgi:hypothetical protein
MAMKGLFRRRNKTAVQRKVKIRKRAEWIGFLRVIMRIEARMAKEAVPRKINHWKMMLIFCSNMEDFSHKLSGKEQRENSPLIIRIRDSVSSDLSEKSYRK